MTLTVPTALVLAVLAARCDAVLASDETRPPPGTPRCEIAVVSPVSGFAECVKPRGASVAAPPPRPPPTPEECARHTDLDLKECRDDAAPKEPGG